MRDSRQYQITPLIDDASLTDTPSILHRRAGGTSRLFLDTWLLEYSSILTAFIAWFGVLALLLVYRDRPLLDWSHGISINTVVSLLATIMKGCLLLTVSSCLGQWKWILFNEQSRNLADFDLLDDASRSIVGAAALLTDVRTTRSACLGSLVVILSLGYDAFFQQSISYPLRAINLKPYDINNNYRYLSDVPFAQVCRDLSNNSTDYTQLKAAVYDGTLYTNVSRTGVAVSAKCPTGNCTFPTFPTLAMCSDCTDISALLQKTCVPISNGTGCTQTVSLPNGLSLANLENLPSLFNMTTKASGLGTYPSNDQNQWIAMLSAIMLPDDVGLKNRSDPGAGVDIFNNSRAYDCVLNFCVKAIIAEEFSGVYSEYIARTFYANESWKGWGSNGSYSLIDLWHSHQLPDNWNDSISSWQAVDDINTTFSVSAQGAFILSETVQGMLDNQHGYLLGVNTFPEGNDIGEAIYLHGADAFPLSISNISLAITNHIRLRGKSWVAGTPIMMTPFFHLTWAWLLLPLVAAVMTTVLTVITVSRTNQNRLPCWKGSILPTMQYGTRLLVHEQGTESHLMATSELKRIASSRSGKTTNASTSISLVSR